MAALDGLVDQWDACPHIRERMRTAKQLFLPEVGKKDTAPTVGCADANFHVLKPLAERLEDPPGQVTMFLVPDLSKKNLDSSILRKWFSNVVLSPLVLHRI